MEIQSGTYVPNTNKVVTVWPKPDANGDGPEVYAERYDDAGNLLGRDLVKDASGQTVRDYLPPAGFVHVPTRQPGSRNETGAYVRVNGRGEPLRDVNGNAIGIRPGTALVEHPDGSTTLLPDDYSHVLFVRAHTRTDASPAAPESAGPVLAPVPSSGPPAPAPWGA